MIVNEGIIDGRVAITPLGAGARFENSGWLGIAAPGAGVAHSIGGTFLQTETGTLTLRIAASGNDSLQVSGPALLDGTLAPVPSGSVALPIGQQYQVVNAQGGITGQFTTVTQSAGLAPGTRADTLYAPTTVNLVITPSSYGNLTLAGLPQTANQGAVGNALDAIGRPPAQR